jgi:purine nucleosidase
MNILRIVGAGLLVVAGIGTAFGPGAASAQTGAAATETAGKDAPQLAILDTDIGDDIDDAFALALLLHSPEVKLLGITTTFGDTELRARLTERYLAAAHSSGIPVAAGRHTSRTGGFTQAAYARQQPDHAHPEAVKFLLDQIKAHPGQITLIAIGPLVNVQDAIARDPVTFRKLKRVVMMGGSVYRGYGDNRPPEPEWNILCDPKGAMALLASGVPVYMMPLDSTQIHLEEAQREKIFSFGSPLTDQITLLYHQWINNTDNHAKTPTLFDPVAVAYAIHPELCPMKPLRLQVDEKGFTRPVDGEPNANVCVKSDEGGFLDLLLGRVASAEH